MAKRAKKIAPKRRPTRMDKVEMAETGRKPKRYLRKKKK